MIQLFLPICIPNTEMMMQPSHDANRNTEVTMDIMVVLGYYEAVSRQSF